MPIYKYLVFDVDDTLLDFYPAFSTAQGNIAEKLGIELSKEYYETDEKCGWKAWEECRLDKTEEKDVQENYHVYYYQYLRKHFEYLLEAYGKVCDVQELVDCYLKSISSSKAIKEPDTLSVYTKLSKKYKLVLATNGIERVQKERLFDFLPYTYKLYISEAIGFIKPTDDFYNYFQKEILHWIKFPFPCHMELFWASWVGMDRVRRLRLVVFWLLNVGNVPPFALFRRRRKKHSISDHYITLRI